MMINGETRLLGVLGNPVKHSQSPKIHNFSSQQLGFNHCYIPLGYQGDDMKSLLDSLWHLGFVGINVTVPYKEVVSQAVKSSLGAVNTLYRGEEDYWQSASTDGIGFIRSVSRIVSLDKIEQVVMLGSGGAAQAVMESLHKAYPELAFVVLRRSAAKDAQIASLVANKVRFDAFAEGALSKALKGKSTLLIQGTSAPIHGMNLQELSPALVHLQGGFSDLCYGCDSALLERARDLKIPHQDGLGMLIEQARESQLLWWGQTVPFESIQNHLLLRGV